MSLRTPSGRIIPTGHSISGDFDTVFEAVFGGIQHDAHVMFRRFVVKHYGTSANYVAEMAEWKKDRAAARERLMQTADGRAWLAQQESK